MTFVVRKVNTARWVETQAAWLQDGDIEADPVGDLDAKENSLSIFFVEDEASAKRAVVAVAVGLNKIKDLGYFWIELEEFNNLGFELDEKQGGTPDTEVNTWHRNIIHLSGQRVLHFARLVREREYRIVALFPEDIARTLNQCIEEKHLQEKHVKDPKILAIMETLKVNN